MNLFELNPNLLTPEQKEILSNQLDMLIKKYDSFAYKSISGKHIDSYSYFYGVADGLNHAFKLINASEDDYLTVEE